LNISEAAGETLEDLHLALLSVVELHPSVDVLLIGRVEADKEAPLLARVDTIGHDLAVGELLSAIENALRGILVGDVHMEDSSLTNKGDLSERHILPVGDDLGDLSLLELLLGVQIEYLY